MRDRPDSDAERWLSVGLRSAHLAAVVWLGAALLGGGDGVRERAGWVLLSGLALLAVDLRARRIALAELAGALVLAKLALLAWMVLDPARATWIFWLLLVASSLSSHAPKAFRHWPAQARASKASKPG